MSEILCSSRHLERPPWISQVLYCKLQVQTPVRHVPAPDSVSLSSSSEEDIWLEHRMSL